MMDAMSAAAPAPAKRSSGNTLPLWLKWHRRAGLAALAGVVLWCVSGVLHPIMTRLQPEPQRQRLDLRVPAAGGALDPIVLLRARGIGALTDLRLISINRAAFYQIGLPGRAERLVLNAWDGSELAHGDRRYAESLARAFSGETQKDVARADLITDTGYEYSYINRLLPVWRIEFDRPDHLRVFIDTHTGRLATLVDNRQIFPLLTFGILHRWLWLEQLSTGVRMIVLGAMLLAALTVAALGLWIYGLRWRHTARKWELRRVHRLIGISASVAGLILPLSGAVHLLYAGLRGDPVLRHASVEPPVSLDELRVPPIEALRRAGGDAAALSLGRVENEVCYRIQGASLDAGASAQGHAHATHVPSGKVTAGFTPEDAQAIWISAKDGSVMTEGEARYLRGRAAQVMKGDPVGEIRTVDHFDDEYGFAFKRLPVKRVRFANDVAVFIDPADGAIAAVTDTADRAEGWFFAYIHKFEWLTPAGENWRDGISALLTLALGTAATLGGILALTRNTRRP